MQLRLNEVMDSFAKRLRAARQQTGMTQAQLGERAGVKQSDISKMERGDSEKSTATPALARALSCDVDWLDAGLGDPDFGRRSKGWPFPDIARERYVALTDNQRAEIQGAVRKMLLDFESGAVGQGPGGRLPPGFSWGDKRSDERKKDEPRPNVSKARSPKGGARA